MAPVFDTFDDDIEDLAAPPAPIPASAAWR